MNLGAFGIVSRNMEEMGGLIRPMPVTAFCFLIGAVAISGLPPLNGFVSEWLDRAGKVYQGLTPLSPADIADAVVWCATRPPHVNISEMIVMPTAQASTMLVHRK